MFSVVKWIRKIVNIFLGGVNWWALSLGIFLGFVLAVIPGFNITRFFVFVVLLALNVNGAVAVLAFALGSVFRDVFVDWMYNVGSFLGIGQPEDYLFWGSIPFAIVLGGLLGFFCSNGILSLRSQMEGVSGKPWIQKFMQWRIGKFLAWLFIGKTKKVPAKIVTKPRLIFAGATIALVLLVKYIFS